MTSFCTCSIFTLQVTFIQINDRNLLLKIRNRLTLKSSFDGQSVSPFEMKPPPSVKPYLSVVIVDVHLSMNDPKKLTFTIRKIKKP